MTVKKSELEEVVVGTMLRSHDCIVQEISTYMCFEAWVVEVSLTYQGRIINAIV